MCIICPWSPKEGAYNQRFRTFLCMTFLSPSIICFVMFHTEGFYTCYRHTDTDKDEYFSLQLKFKSTLN